MCQKSYGIENEQKSTQVSLVTFNLYLQDVFTLNVFFFFYYKLTFMTSKA